MPLTDREKAELFSWMLRLDADMCGEDDPQAESARMVLLRKAERVLIPMMGLTEITFAFLGAPYDDSAQQEALARFRAHENW
jgi:hypothetical protein